MRSRCQNLPGKMQNSSKRLEEIRILEQIYHMWPTLPTFPPHYCPQLVLHSLESFKNTCCALVRGEPESWESPLVAALCRKGMKMEDAAVEMFSWFAMGSYSFRGQVSVPNWQRQSGYIYPMRGRNKLVVCIFCLRYLWQWQMIITGSLGMKCADSLLRYYLIYKINYFQAVGNQTWVDTMPLSQFLCITPEPFH